MNVIVRFYWQHDLDLVALARNTNFSMAKWMKQAILAYSRGDENFRIPIPSEISLKQELSDCSIHFVLKPGVDDEAIKIMSGFCRGTRNSALKMIFRSYLDATYLLPYLRQSRLYQPKARGRIMTPISDEPIQMPLTVIRKNPNETKIPTFVSKSPDKQESMIPETPESKESNHTVYAQNDNLSKKDSTTKDLHSLDDNSKITAQEKNNSSDDSNMKNESSETELPFAGDESFDLFSAIESLM